MLLNLNVLNKLKHMFWAGQILDEYLRFLTIRLKVTAPFSPSGLVDKAWHAHILDTQAYASDMDRLFGRFIHHTPSFEPDAAEQVEMAERYNHAIMQYRILFGEPPADIWPVVDMSAAGFVPTCCCT